MNKEEKDINEEEYTYKKVIKEKKNSRIFSVASLALGILSLVFCFLPILGIILALSSIIFSLISRGSLGYFDKIAIIGLVVGIFGAVFGLSYAVFDFMKDNTNFFAGIFSKK